MMRRFHIPPRRIPSDLRASRPHIGDLGSQRPSWKPTFTLVACAPHRLQPVQTGGNLRARSFLKPRSNPGLRRSGGKQHGQRGGVRVDLRIDAHLADQLCHRTVDIGLHPGRPMIEAEVRQTGQEDAA